MSPGSFFQNLVNQRFSARDYLDQKVEREKIELCLEAARLAPSACNSQPWRFIVIDDPSLKNRICDNIFSGPYRMNLFVKKAPVLVVIISEKGNFMTKIGNFFRNTRYYLIDIGIAVEHFVLQATELGLGTCWIGWFNEKALKKELGLPKSAKIDVILSLGYSPAVPPDKKRKSLPEISSFNLK
jgi:nitroreductase